MNDLKKSFYAIGNSVDEDKLCTYFNVICVGSYVLHILFFVVGFLFKINLLLLSFVTMVIYDVFFIMFCPRLTKIRQNIGFFLFQSIPIFMVSSLFTTPVLSFSKTVAKRTGNGSAIAMVAVVIFFIVIASFIALYFGEESSVKVNALKEIIRTGVCSTDKYERKKGDVQLCIVKETGEPEIWHNKDRFLHMLILGPTGSGKTSQTIIPLINQDMQDLTNGITIIEPKGDLAQKAAMMAKHYGRSYVYFDPSLQDGKCPFFNPLVGAEADVVENIATTFRMLNPDSPQFFLDLNEQLVKNALKVLKRLDKYNGTDGEYSTFINLNTILQNPKNEGKKFINDLMRAANNVSVDEIKENQDICAWFANEYYAERSKVYENTSGLRSQVAKLVSNEYLRKVLNPDPSRLRPDGRQECNDIDFDKHLEDGGVICISTAQGALRDLGRYLGYFIILQLQSAVFRRPGNENTRRHHYLYIDEFQTYSNPGFSDMLTQGRSYRVASHLATQARAQMAMGGGKDSKNFVELVSTNTRNIVLYPGCAKDDAEYYSKQFGEYEKIETQIGKSYKKFNLITGGLDKLGHPTETVRETKKMTAIFTPTDLIYHPFGEIVYCLIRDNSIQTPKLELIEYIPKDLNEKLDKMISEEIMPYMKGTPESMTRIQNEKDAFRNNVEKGNFNNVNNQEDSDVDNLENEVKDLGSNEVANFSNIRIGDKIDDIIYQGCYESSEEDEEDDNDNRVINCDDIDADFSHESDYEEDDDV